MSRVCPLFLFGCMFILSGGLVGQDEKKQDAKKEDPKTKLKGMLPANWSKLGLADTQKQDIYKIQGKYKEEMAKLKAKMSEMQAEEYKEMRAVLTAEQKKKLEELVLGKDKDK